MTIDEFQRQPWTGGMKASYRGQVYAVAATDFDEFLVGLKGVILSEPEEISWVRCENVTLISS